MKNCMFSTILIVILMCNVTWGFPSDPNEPAVGNPTTANGWSTTDAVLATSSGYQYTLEPVCAINGSGLDTATGTMHSNDIWDLYWDGPPGGGITNPHPGTVSCLNWIAFEFDKEYPLTIMHVWNYNYGSVFNCGAGAKDVVVQYSSTGGSDPAEWTTLGTYQVDKGTAQMDFVGNDVCNFRGKKAKYVCLSIVSDWGTPYGDQGIAEVRFYYPADPNNYVPPDGWELTIAAEPETVMTISPMAGTYMLDPGTVQAISAAPYIVCPDTWVFDHWEGEGIANPASANTTVLMSEDRTVTAVYVLDNQCGDSCHPIPVGDLNEDCIVDLADLSITATHWLENTQP